MRRSPQTSTETSAHSAARSWWWWWRCGRTPKSVSSAVSGEVFQRGRRIAAGGRGGAAGGFVPAGEADLAFHVGEQPVRRGQHVAVVAILHQVDDVDVVVGEGVVDGGHVDVVVERQVALERPLSVKIGHHRRGAGAGGGRGRRVAQRRDAQATPAPRRPLRYGDDDAFRRFRRKHRNVPDVADAI